MKTNLNPATLVSETTEHHLACAEKLHKVLCSLALATVVWKVLALQDWVLWWF